jgi:hypothetical protein
MTNDRDPALRSLFQTAREEIQDEAFTTQVMSQIEQRRRRTITGWVGIALVLAPCAWLLGTVLQDAVLLLTQVLPSTLVDLDNRWLTQLLAPVNSISGLVALGVLGLRALFRKIF